ncbi:MAG: YIP1 family protein [Gemmataceae bacterium]
MALREVVKEAMVGFERWKQALLNPQQFLEVGFQPTEDQLTEGLEFYLMMFVVSFVLFAPLALAARGEVATKTKVIINGALGLLFTALVAMTWFAAFWLLGGHSNFTGTLLAYIYSATPYLPPTAFCSLLIFTGLPTELRAYALNPATAQAAMQVAAEDPQTSKGMVALGGLGSLGLMLWSVVVVFRSFGFVHELSGWKFAAAIALSIVVAAPVSSVLRRLSLALQGSTGLDLPGGLGD